MDVLPPADGLLPRGEQAELHERIMAETRRAAWLNTARHAILTLGGWTFGVCATAVAVPSSNARPIERSLACMSDKIR